MIGKARLSARARTALAAILIAAPVYGPAMAQDGEPDEAAATEQGTDASACAPGSLGEGGEYTPRGQGSADRIVRAELAFQCERTLDDGTYVPGGYRVQLYETCDAGECELPFVFASEGEGGNYLGRYSKDGTVSQVRIRANRNGAPVLMIVTGGGRGQQQERERERYTLRASR